MTNFEIEFLKQFDAGVAVADVDCIKMIYDYGIFDSREDSDGYITTLSNIGDRLFCVKYKINSTKNPEIVFDDNSNIYEIAIN